MASTNKTTNYELSQFIGTDKPAWLTDYNGDMQKIDTAIKNASDSASTAQTTAETAQSSADSALSSASTALDTAQSASSTATSAQTTAETASSNASTALSTANEAKSTADGLATDVQTAQTTANTANSKADTNATNITTLNTSVSNVESEVASLQNQLKLTDIDNVEMSTIAPSASCTGTLTLAQNTQGSIFKLYGDLTYQSAGSADLSFDKIAIPKGTSTDVQYYGIDTGLVLNTAPEAMYFIRPAGSLICMNKTTGAFNWITGSSFAIGADGHIYINISTTQRETFYGADKYSLLLTPSLYINTNFGDEPVTPPSNA